jgi:HK97 family phage prohead protease
MHTTLAPIDRKGMEYLEVAGRSIKAVDDSLGTITGHLAVFNNVDLGADKILPGAFSKAIRDAKAERAKNKAPFLWPLLWDHNQNLPPIGGISDAYESSYGLAITARLDLGNSLAQDIYSGLKFGSISPMSIGYKTVASSFEKDAATGKTVRLLSQLDLMEGSFCNFAMNPLARTTSVKGGYPMNMLALRGKDFNANYQSEQLDDWRYQDWSGLSAALQQSILNLFVAGANPVADFEQDVAPQLLAALRQYIADGVSLGYSTVPASAQGVYPMMSMPGAGGESKSVYLSASDRTRIKESSAMIMKHAKIIQSASANVERANTRARANALAGYPVYSSASAPLSFEEKEEHDEVEAMLKTINTGLQVEADLREIRETMTPTESPLSASVDRALARLIESKRR